MQEHAGMARNVAVMLRHCWPQIQWFNGVQYPYVLLPYPCAFFKVLQVFLSGFGENHLASSLFNVCWLLSIEEGILEAELQAAKSIELEAMFRADSEGKGVWKLDMPYEALKAFITFFYTGRISSSVLVNHLITLLEAARKYNVQFLTSVCEDSLVKNVTRDNVINAFDMVKKYCSSGCKEAVVEKARRLGELSSFTEYKVFTETNPGLLLELYEQLTDPPGQSPSKKMKFSPGQHKTQHHGHSELFLVSFFYDDFVWVEVSQWTVFSAETDFAQPNDGNVHMSDDENIKSETDEDESVDDEDVKTGKDRMPG